MFVSIADGFYNNTEIEFEGDKVSVSVPVCICSSTGRFVSVTSVLHGTFDTNIYTGFFHEIAFEIDVIYLFDHNESFSTQDRFIAANYIPRECRATVMDIVCASYTRLIERIRPGAIYRVVKDRACDPRGMIKHNKLTNVIEACGYGITETGPDPFGRWFWLMNRNVP